MKKMDGLKYKVGWKMNFVNEISFKFICYLYELKSCIL